MFNSILLIVLIALLVTIIVIILVAFSKKDNLVAREIHDIFENEVKTLAKAYAEEKQIATWIEGLAKKGELNIQELASDARKVAYALAVKKAQNAVTLAEGTLDSLNRDIAEEEKNLSRLIKGKFGFLIEDSKNTLKELTKQKQYVETLVRDAHARLDSLTRL